MSMTLDEDGYERMRAHQRASDRAAVSRADENEKLKERIKELEAEVNRWKPRPMSEAPRDGTYILILERDGKYPWPAIGYWHSAPEAFLERGTRRVIADDAYGWFPIPTAEELKQIGGRK